MPQFPGKHRHHGSYRFGSPQAGRRTCSEFSFRSAQYRGGAGAIGRHPGQQRGLLPGLRFPQSGAFLRADSPENLSACARSDPRRQGGDAGHAEDLHRRRHRYRRPDGEPVPGAARRRGDHHHQCRGLRPYHLRPVDPPRADHRRRGHGQRRLRRAGRFLATQPDRGRRAPAVRTGRDRPLRRRLPALRTVAHHRDRHGRARLPARWQAVRRRHRARRSRPHDGRVAAVRPDHPRRPSRHGQKRARHQYRLQRRARLARRSAARRAHGDRQWRHRRLLLARNVGRTARHPHHRRADRHSVEPDQARRHQRGRIRAHQGPLDRIAELTVLRGRNRRPVGGAARRPRAPAQAPARPRPADRRLSATLAGLDPPLGGKPRAGNHRDHHQAESPGQGAQRADPGAVAALAPGGKPRRQAPATLRLARIRLDRAGRRRGAVRIPRGVLSPDAQAAGNQPREIRGMAGGGRKSTTAAPR